MLKQGTGQGNNKLKGLVGLVDVPAEEVAQVGGDLAEGESKLTELEVA